MATRCRSPLACVCSGAGLAAERAALGLPGGSSAPAPAAERASRAAIRRAAHLARALAAFWRRVVAAVAGS